MSIHDDTGAPEKVSSVNFLEFSTYILSKKRKDKNLMNCPFCSKDSWIAQPSLTDPNKPIVLMMPVQNTKDASMWFFPLSCGNCGYSIYFNAKSVADEIKG